MDLKEALKPLSGEKEKKEKKNLSSSSISSQLHILKEVYISFKKWEIEGMKKKKKILQKGILSSYVI